MAANRSVAPITCDDRSNQLEFQGTAFEVVGGNAITASHVVAGCGVGALISLGEPTASVIQDDPTHDLALLSVGGAESGYEPPALRPESAAPYVGEEVAMLGLNGGAERRVKVAFGHVIGVGKTARLESAGGLRETLTDVILVRASGVLPGESGGPAIDAAGKVVGVIEGSGNGLVDLTPAAHLPSGTPFESLPALIAGGWVGTKPSQVEFSADSGNIVTGIKWSSWTRTGAVGHGTSGLQKCVPTCAAGTIDYVPTRIVLSDPQGGHFTELTEARNGQRTVARYRSAGWPLGAS